MTTGEDTGECVRVADLVGDGRPGGNVPVLDGVPDGTDTVAVSDMVGVGVGDLIKHMGGQGITMVGKGWVGCGVPSVLQDWDSITINSTAITATIPRNTEAQV